MRTYSQIKCICMNYEMFSVLEYIRIIDSSGLFVLSFRVLTRFCVAWFARVFITLFDLGGCSSSATGVWPRFACAHSLFAFQRYFRTCCAELGAVAVLCPSFMFVILDFRSFAGYRCWEKTCGIIEVKDSNRNATRLHCDLRLCHQQ